jgi:hypothetical protein
LLVAPNQPLEYFVSYGNLNEHESTLDEAIQADRFIIAHSILRSSGWFGPSLWSKIRHGDAAEQIRPFILYLQKQDSAMYLIIMQILGYTCGTSFVNRIAKKGECKEHPRCLLVEALPSQIARAAQTRDKHQDKKWSALTLAALYGNERVVQFIIMRDTNFVTEQCRGEHPFRVAVRHHHVQVINLFLKFIPDSINKALMNASLLDIVRGSIPNNGKSALDLAKKRDQIAELLLEKGASANATETVGRSVLMMAISSNFPEDLVRLLLKHDADSDTVDFLGTSPLFEALNYEQFEVATTLLHEKAHNLHIGSPNAILPVLTQLQQTESGMKLCDSLRSHKALDIREAEEQISQVSLWMKYDEALGTLPRSKKKIRRATSSFVSYCHPQSRSLPSLRLRSEIHFQPNNYSFIRAHPPALSTTQLRPESSEYQVTRASRANARRLSNTVEDLFRHLGSQTTPRPLPIPPQPTMVPSVSDATRVFSSIDLEPLSRPGCVPSMRATDEAPSRRTTRANVDNQPIRLALSALDPNRPLKRSSRKTHKTSQGFRPLDADTGSSRSTTGLRESRWT